MRKCIILIWRNKTVFRTYCTVAGLVFTSVISLVSNAMSQDINLKDVGSLHRGFRIVESAGSAELGFSVSGAGDVNGDGYADLLVGSPLGTDQAGEQTGAVYLIFGKAFPSDLQVDELTNADDAVVFRGESEGDRLGHSVSGAGDVNADGFADFIFSAPYAQKGNSSGVSYVVFGSEDLESTSVIDLGNKGYRILGENPEDRAGFSVSGAGDFNGDGFSDVIIGATNAFGVNLSNVRSGGCAVVFGKATTEDIHLGELDSKGVRFIEENNTLLLNLGFSVSGASDVNSDGYSDVIFCVPRRINTEAFGAIYVVYGAPNRFEINLNELESSGTGFKIVPPGRPAYDFIQSVSGVGDFNGDSYADLVLGLPDAFDPEAFLGGEGYMIYGGAYGVPVDLAALGTKGIKLRGFSGGHSTGYSVCGTGDLDGDGFQDLLLSSGRASITYVVNGREQNNSMILGSEEFQQRGFKIRGARAASVSGIGDFNRDGLPDYVIGQNIIQPNELTGSEAIVYVLFSESKPPVSATYNSVALGGNSPRVAVGITGDGSNDSSPDSRCSIDFADGASSPSLQTVILTRGNSAIANLGISARVMWEINTNRQQWKSARVTFHYTDEEIAGLSESSLKLFGASSPSGPWKPVQNVAHKLHSNQISGSTSEFGFFALQAEPNSPLNAWMVR
jgi:hypothetical protein